MKKLLKRLFSFNIRAKAGRFNATVISIGLIERHKILQVADPVEFIAALSNLSDEIKLLLSGTNAILKFRDPGLWVLIILDSSEHDNYREAYALIRKIIELPQKIQSSILVLGKAQLACGVSHGVVLVDFRDNAAPVIGKSVDESIELLNSAVLSQNSVVVSEDFASHLASDEYLVKNFLGRRMLCAVYK